MKHVSELKQLANYLIHENPYLNLRKWKTCAIGHLVYAEPDTKLLLWVDYSEEDWYPYWDMFNGREAVERYFDIDSEVFLHLFGADSYVDYPSGSMVGERILNWLLNLKEIE